ncbi:peptidoglycan-binding domain-containing protein [Devosia aurantiaca]|uniref:Peptidoglycan-binding protein n=1 Tax=Devosia aurantiaca TaxID=2714858 RepID=A0A6M1SGS3_9HYPH|nr:peptidoglycan-binding domain-containing protein [Devosia aurantiaca]NGP18667.1 peptidoglycan-binding protein [Devosia aurantiaca]
MTASTLTQLPLMAGSALLGTLSRAGLWTFSRYMKAPMASTGILAMVTMTALAGSNALYFQTAEHPSPFFAPAHQSLAAAPTPVAERPELAETVPALPPIPAATEVAAPMVTSNETTGSVPPPMPDGPVGNAKMFEVQKKLFELQLFSGKVDGYYGPKTAEAIRAFEQRNGMKLTGSTDAAVLEAILSSDASGRVTQPVVAQPVVAQPQAQAAPAQVQPPAPVVQQAALAVAPTVPVAAEPQQDQLVARVPGLTRAEEAFDGVAQSAASTIDSIIAAVDTPRTTNVQPVANPPVPKASLPVVQSQQPMPAPIAPSPATQQAAAPVAPAVRAPAADPVPYVAPATDSALVSQIQRGLASLGFFRAPIDGKPGAETARAIREFENFHSYRMTGQVKPDLVELLLKAGATI